MFIVNAGCVIVILFATLSAVEGLRCYVCDSKSVIGYYDAEKDCNTDRSLQQCRDVKDKACMIEAFRHEAGSVYHIVKRCLVECPAYVNGSAEHTRCCSKEACNDVISIDVIDHRTASDLVAHVREPLPQQPPRLTGPVEPPALVDDSTHHDTNAVDAERVDNDDDFQRLLPPAELWTLPPPQPPPLPPPPSAGSTPRSTTERPAHRLEPATETSSTPPPQRRDRRPLPGASGGTQWWKGGLRSSSTSQRSTTAIVLTALVNAAFLSRLIYVHVDLTF